MASEIATPSSQGLTDSRRDARCPRESDEGRLQNVPTTCSPCRLEKANPCGPLPWGSATRVANAAPFAAAHELLQQGRIALWTRPWMDQFSREGNSQPLFDNAGVLARQMHFPRVFEQATPSGLVIRGRSRTTWCERPSTDSRRRLVTGAPRSMRAHGTRGDRPGTGYHPGGLGGPGSPRAWCDSGVVRSTDTGLTPSLALPETDSVSDSRPPQPGVGREESP